MSPAIKLILCIILSVILMSTECRKDLIIEYKYKFLEKVDLYPVQKSYHVGDTLWLQYSNPNHQFYDQVTNQKIFSDTIALIFASAFNSRYEAPVNPIDSLFSLKIENALAIGNVYDYGQGVLIATTCPASYNFRIGIVPKHTGIYSIDMPVIPETLGSCTNNMVSSPFSTIEYRFNLTDCNKDVYLSIPPASRGESIKGYTEKAIDNKQVFVFKVEG